jgi:two-component system, OmpR family, response regulator
MGYPAPEHIGSGTRSIGGIAVHSMLNVHWSSSKMLDPGPGPSGSEQAEERAMSRGLIRKVLVVDDEVDLANLAEALLCSEGLEVVVANSAREALDILARDADIDAIFSDIMMPGMTGLQLADAVTEMYPRVKIVLTSGYTMPALFADRQRQYLFTPKPYRLDTIMKLLRS